MLSLHNYVNGKVYKWVLSGRVKMELADKIMGGVLITSVLADAVSLVTTGQKVSDFIPNEGLEGFYLTASQYAPAFLLLRNYFVGRRVKKREDSQQRRGT